MEISEPKGLVKELIERSVFLLINDDFKEMLQVLDKDLLKNVFNVDDVSKIDISSNEVKLKLVKLMYMKDPIKTLDLLAERSLIHTRIVLGVLTSKLLIEFDRAKKEGNFDYLNELKKRIEEVIDKFIVYVIDPRDKRIVELRKKLRE